MHDTKTQVQIVSTEKYVSYIVTDEMLIIARNIESGLLCGSEKQLSLAVSKIIELHEQIDWISVKDSVPDFSGMYIVCDRNEKEDYIEYDVALFDASVGCFNPTAFCHVTHYLNLRINND